MRGIISTYTKMTRGDSIRGDFVLHSDGSNTLLTGLLLYVVMIFVGLVLPFTEQNSYSEQRPSKTPKGK